MTKKGVAFDGVEAVAEMLRGLSGPEREKLLANLAAREPELAEKLQKRILTFEMLKNADDRVLQATLRQVPDDRLALALRKASEEVKAAIFRNLAARAAERVREEIAAMGPQRLSDVEAVQAQILAIFEQQLSKA